MLIRRRRRRSALPPSKSRHLKQALLTAMAGRRSSVPSMAAATVPEQNTSVPRLGPWLMPDSTRSGGASSSSNSASFTQSAGVPLQAQAVMSLPNNRSARSARIGCCRVSPWPVAERSLSGQTTVTWWPRPAAASARALMPSANTPSSLLIRILSGAIRGARAGGANLVVTTAYSQLPSSQSRERHHHPAAAHRSARRAGS